MTEHEPTPPMNTGAGSDDQPPEPPSAPPPFPVVGIGASAGGVEALAAFFGHLPPDSGMAFLVILHRPADADSQLAAILHRHTAMPVVEVTEPVPIAPNQIYVLPPQAHLAIANGTLQRTERAPTDGTHLPIDQFFRTLAAAYDGHAAAIVLSGTGSDGALGIGRIKEAGGVTLAQDPQDAAWNGMPRAAIGTGLVDIVQPAAALPHALISYWEHGATIAVHADGTAAALRDIFALLRVRTGHDFSQYKRPTVHRRLQRRMQVTGVPDLVAYLALLRSQPDAVQALLADLLISVTNFFRDRDAWAAVQALTPQLFRTKGPDDQVRVWVAACATGEEAYSVAMLLREWADTLEAPPRIQVFATDIDDAAITVARHGVYPATIAGDVSPARLQRFFVPDQGGYRIKQELRDLLLFARHNVLHDPPFSRVDLITCRNLLIYFNREAQEAVLRTFHFSLRPGGALLLGSAESLDGALPLFTTLDKTHRLFQRQGETRGAGVLLAPPDMPPALPAPPVSASQVRLRPVGSFGELHGQLVAAYTPPSVIVTGEGDIVHLHGGVGQFLRFGDGDASQNLLRMVLPDLRLDLRTAFFTARQSGAVTEARGVRAMLDGTVRLIDMIVQPIGEPAWARGAFLVVLHDAGAATEVGEPRVSEAETVVAQLEAELDQTRSQLRATVEQYEAAVEEYKAANEELQAINEELRAATEELETSKEELQSVNEELTTLNGELQHTVAEVSRGHNDLQNLIASTQIGTIFLDRELRVKRFTPAVQAIFNLLPADLGRPLAHVTHTLQADGLTEDATAVLHTLTPLTREVQTRSGAWYLLRVLPYRTLADRIDGVVLTFVDITERKEAEAERERLLRETESARATADLERRRLLAVLEQLPVGVYIAEAPSGRVVFDNAAVRDICGEAPFSTSIDDYSLDYGGHYPAGHPRAGERLASHKWPLARTLTTGEPVAEELVEIRRPDGTRRLVSISAVAVRDADERVVGAVATNVDVTDMKRAEEALRASEAKYRTLFMSMDEGYAVVDVLADANGDWNDFLFIDVNPAFVTQTGMDYPVGRKATELLGTPNPHWAQTYGRVAATGEPIRFEESEAVLGRTFDLYCFRLDGDGSRRVAVLFTDITERKQREQRQAFLLQFSDALRAEPDADAVANRAIQMLSEQMQLDRCYIGVYRLAEDRGDFTHQVGNERVPPLPSGVRLSDFPDALRVALDRTLVIDDVAETAGLSETDRRNLAALGMRALVAATLRKGEHNPLWSIVAISARPRHWTWGEIVLIEEVTERTWTAVERAKAEAALRESEQRMRALVENLPGSAVFIVDRDLRYRLAAGDALRTVATATDDFLGKTIFEALDTEQAAAYERRYRQALQGESFVHEHDGDGHTFVSRGVPLRDGDDQISAVLMVSYDITDRRQAEHALRESEAQLRIAVEAAEMGTWDWNLTTNRVHWNDRHFTLFGMTPDGTLIRPETFFAHVHPDDRAHLREQLDRTLRERVVFAAEFRVVHADDTIRWITSYGQVVAEADGRATRVSGVMLDITARKQAEERVRASEARFRTVTDAVPQVIWANDAAGTATYFNQRWFEYSGLSLDESVGPGWQAIVHPDDAPASVARWQQALAAAAIFDTEYRLRRADGAYRWHLGRNVPLHDDTGRVAGWFGSATDIHDEHLARDAAQAARAEAEAALQIRDQFLSIASHELRTPLTALLGYAHMLPLAVQQGKGDPLRMTTMITRQAQRLNALINQLLDMSRLQQGQFAIQRQPIDLAAVVAQVVDEFRAALPADTSHAVTLTAPDAPVEVTGDVERLEQVILNLLSNAVKYSPAGGSVHVRVATTATEAIVEVEDQGIGIPADARERLFDAFYRAGNVGGQISGFGLGLHIVREIVARHGGRIAVASVEGQGSTFRVVLPCLQTTG